MNAREEKLTEIRKRNDDKLAQSRVGDYIGWYHDIEWLLLELKKADDQYRLLASHVVEPKKEEPT